MFKILLDVIQEECFIYLIKNKKIFDKISFINQQNLSNHLPLYINSLLTSNKITIEDIKCIFWVYGPGKFSSCRIVSIFIKTIKLVKPDIKIYTIDKFSYLGWNDKSLVILKSDGDKYFVANVKNHELSNEPILIKENELKSFIEKQDKKNIIYDFNNEQLIIDSLIAFKEVDENFELKYFKPVC